MITALDSQTALVVIDLQKGLLGYPVAPHPIADVVAKSSQLAAAFRRRGLPVVLVNVVGGAPGRIEQKRITGAPAPDWAELVPDLDPQPRDHRVTKKTWGAFANTDLAAYLRAQGVTQIVLTGVATSIGVESTARTAYELGFNVALATDAMTDLSPEAHAHSVERIFPRLGETGLAHEIIALLGPAAGA